MFFSCKAKYLKSGSEMEIYSDSSIVNRYYDPLEKIFYEVWKTSDTINPITGIKKYKSNFLFEQIIIKNGQLENYAKWSDNKDSFVIINYPNNYYLPLYAEIWVGKKESTENINNHIKIYGHPQHNQFIEHSYIYWGDTNKLSFVNTFYIKSFSEKTIEFDKNGDTISYKLDKKFDDEIDNSNMSASAKMSMFNKHSIFYKRKSNNGDTLEITNIDTVINFPQLDSLRQPDHNEEGTLRFIILIKNTYLVKQQKVLKSEKYLYRYNWFEEPEWEFFQDFYNKEIKK